LERTGGTNEQWGLDPGGWGWGSWDTFVGVDVTGKTRRGITIQGLTWVNKRARLKSPNGLGYILWGGDDWKDGSHHDMETV